MGGSAEKAAGGLLALKGETGQGHAKGDPNKKKTTKEAEKKRKAKKVKTE